MNSVHSFKNKEILSLITILIVTLLVYFPSLSYDFYPNLDDGRLILNNETVTQFPINAKSIFTEFVYGLYHPATTFSFIIDYGIWGNNPLGFRIHNLLLHLLNSLLVFIFIKKLTHKFEISLLTTILFALHPLHIESVVWISERKDVLFTFWFLLAGISYQNHLKTNKTFWFICTYLFFILSLLSKATAVVFPLVLVLIDYYNDNNFSSKKIVAKSPFFLLSIIIGIVNIKAQNSIDFIQPISYQYNLIQLVTIPIYSLSYYITHFFAPIGLAAKHLYPRVIDGQINTAFYLGWFWFILLIFVAYRNRKNSLFIVGILFYLFTIGLTLKIIPTGNDIVSERYSYVPYIGLALAFSSIAIPYFINKLKLGLSALIGTTIILSLLSFIQISHWENEISIWSKVVQTEPELPLAYYERGNAYKDKLQFKKAIVDYDAAIKYSPEFYMAYIQRGLCYYFEKNNVQALTNFNVSIKLDSDNPEGYYNRGNLYLKLEKYELALLDIKKSINLNIQINETWLYKGIIEKNMNSFDAALKSFAHYLQLQPNHWQTQLEIADCYYLSGNFKDAETQFEKLLRIDNNNLEVKYKLANTLARNRKYNKAVNYYNEIILAKPDFGSAFLNRGNAFFYLKNIHSACLDWQKAYELGAIQAKLMIDNYCN